MAQRVGIRIVDNFDSNINKKNNIIYKILEITTKWFQDNLEESDACKEYLKKSGLNVKTKMFKNCEHRIPVEGSSLGLAFLKKNLL